MPTEEKKRKNDETSCYLFNKLNPLEREEIDLICLHKEGPWKVTAIKALRAAAGCGLKEAKYAIEYKYC